MRPGHVFLVHGHLQDVTCDAILLPTDTSFSVAPYWVDLIGDQPQRPAGWPRDGRVSPDIFWFVDVTDDNHVALDAALLRARLRERVAQIATALAGRSVVRGRAQHLVTLPLIGAGGGGQPAGAMVAAVLDELAALTEQHPLDFAVVVPERPIFEALQRHRRAGHTASPDDLAARLGRRAREGSLSLMIGAGVSMGAGLPSWDGLLKSVAATLPDHAREAVMKTGESDAEAPQFRDDFSALSPLDQAQLLEALLGTALRREVVAAASNRESKGRRRPALGHLLLAGLQCRQVATTNYDDLYETAVRSQQGGDIAKLPYQRPVHAQPWILKMHGDVEHEGDIVLTRSSFVAYDGRHRPAGSLFQSMLMTSHVLFVGVSLTDDNVLRLTHEVAHYVDGALSGSETATTPDAALLGTVLTLAPDVHRRRLWQGSLEWHAVGEDDTRVPDNARHLEILLDSIAMWAVPELA